MFSRGGVQRLARAGSPTINARDDHKPVNETRVIWQGGNPISEGIVKNARLWSSGVDSGCRRESGFVKAGQLLSVLICMEAPRAFSRAPDRYLDRYATVGTYCTLSLPRPNQPTSRCLGYCSSVREPQSANDTENWCLQRCQGHPAHTLAT